MISHRYILTDRYMFLRDYNSTKIIELLRFSHFLRIAYLFTEYTLPMGNTRYRTFNKLHLPSPSFPLELFLKSMQTSVTT